MLEICTVTSRMLRSHFGRGPESCLAYHHERYLVFYLRGFLSPMESVLLKNGNTEQVEISRGIVMESVLAQLKGVLELEFQREVIDHYHDWNFPNNTGMITVVFEGDPLAAESLMQFPERDELMREVARISQLVQKVPDQMEVFRIAPKLFLVKRSGILVAIEKALIAKGHQQILQVTKDDLEKTYFHRDGRFEDIFKQKVSDIFLDWNFHEDNSMMCFVLK